MKLKSLVAALAVATGGFATSAHAIPVALELSLVIDISGSISTSEYNTQRTGYANAFANAGIQSAIASFAGGIAVNVIQFGTNAVEVISWTHLQTVADVAAFSTTLAGMARNTSIGSSTDIEDGVVLSTASFTNGFEGARLVMDVSADGIQNTDPSCSAAGACAALQAARDAAALAGITINALAIEGDFGATGVGDHLQTNIVTAGGFLVRATGFDDFERAAITKIGREITGTVSTPGTLALAGLALAGMGGLARRQRRA